MLLLDWSRHHQIIALSPGRKDDEGRSQQQQGVLDNDSQEDHSGARSYDREAVETAPSPSTAASTTCPRMQQHDIKRRLGRSPEYATALCGTRKGVEYLRRFSGGCHDALPVKYALSQTRRHVSYTRRTLAADLWLSEVQIHSDHLLCPFLSATPRLRNAILVPCYSRQVGPPGSTKTLNLSN